MSQEYLEFNDLVQTIDFDMNAGPELTRLALLRAARHIQQKMAIPLEIEITVEDGVGLYDYGDQIPEGFVVKCIDAVKYCDRCIDTVEWCDPCPHGYEICDMLMQQIKITPTPVATDNSQKIGMRLHLESKFSNGVVPNYFCRFSDLLIDLATAYLAEKPGHEWSNPNYARDLLQRANGCLVSNTVRQSRDGSASVRSTAGCPVL